MTRAEVAGIVAVVALWIVIAIQPSVAFLQGLALGLLLGVTLSIALDPVDRWLDGRWRR